MSTTEQTTTDETTDETTEPLTEPETTPESAEDEARAGDPEPEASRAARDAAKYRRQLRTVEAERDALASQLDAMRRAQVADAAKAAGVAAESVWASGRTPADLIDDAGVIDAGKVAEALTDARARFGAILPAAPPATGQGNVGGGVHGDGKGDFVGAFARP